MLAVDAEALDEGMYALTGNWVVSPVRIENVEGESPPVELPGLIFPNWILVLKFLPCLLSIIILRGQSCPNLSLGTK